MIVVIADDLTGAAEIAGLGLHHELIVQLDTTVPESTDAGLLVISTDTRSVSEEEAVRLTKEVTASIMKLQPKFVYKKTDSVLRGHVLAEIETHLHILGLNQALIIPANPSLGRTIKDGNYYIKGEPIHHTSFSTDPEFAIGSSDVRKMIRGDVQVKKIGDVPPVEGITIGEAQNKNDLASWSAAVNENILPVGGGDFFSALLAAKNIPLNNDPEEAIGLQLPMLFVSGTTFNKAVALISSIKVNGGPVNYIPAAFINDEEVHELLMPGWVSETTGMLVLHGKAIIAIDPATVSAGSTALLLRQKMALAIEMIFDRGDIRELFIEGGSTAAAVINKLGFTSFYPVEELKRGVVRMNVENRPGLFVTVKPGSYDWPTGIWDFENYI